MSGTFSITVSEARGYVAVPADLDALAVVMGCSSAGSGQSAFYLSAASAVAGLGYGDAVDSLCQIIEQRQSGGATGKKFPAAMYTTPPTTPGSYGAINVSGVTGTALISFSAASLPLGTYEPKIKIISGGIVGTAGTTFQYSLDNGRNWSRTIALGTADFYLVPNSGVKFLFSPSTTDLTALNTLINEEFTDYNAHVVLTTGTVHTNADTVDQVSAGTYPSATNTATRVARINAIITAAKLHFVKGTGGSPATHINAGGDAAGLTALNLIPTATDDESALFAALAFKAALNTHDAGTTWHTIADATNVVTSPAPSAGTLLANDVAYGRTFGPAPVAADLDTAFTAMSLGSTDFSIIVLDFPLTVALAAHVTTGLNALAAVGRRVTCFARYRLPDFEASETRTAWGVALAAEFPIGTFDDSRIYLVDAFGLITDATTTRQYLRSFVGQIAADFVRVPRGDWADSPHDQKMANATLIDANGVTIGHDEGARGDFTGLSNDTLGGRFGSVERLSDSTRREDVYLTVPWVLYAADERIRTVMVRRLVNALERVVVAAGTPLLGNRFAYVSTGVSTGILTDASRESLHGTIYQAVSSEFGTEFTNAQDAGLDTGLIQVDPAVVVSGGNILGLSITAAPRLPGYAKDLTFVIAVEQ